MSSIKQNFTCKINEICQKNGLAFSFKKLDISNPSKKHFVMELTIVNKMTNASVCYRGNCFTVQRAKHLASKAALSDDFLYKLKGVNRCDSTNDNSVQRPWYQGNQQVSTGQQNQHNSSTPMTNQRQAQFLAFDVRKQPTEVQSTNQNKLTPVDLFEKNYIYDLYVIVKKLNLRLKIDSAQSQKGDAQVAVTVLCDNKPALGRGEDDLTAIQNAAKQIQIDKSRLPNRENLEREDDLDKHDYISDLNKIHLLTSKNLECNCISSIELATPSMYLYKCQIGGLIAYGLGESKHRAQNAAASTLIQNLKDRLEGDVHQLDEQLMGIENKKKKLTTILDKIEELEDLRKRKKARFSEN